jgi:hypothetical protein
MFNVEKVRLFRVVTWMEEREAGAAAAREKVRLGYDRKGPKLLGSFKATFPKAFETEVLLCPVRLPPYESDRKGEKLENFLHRSKRLTLVFCASTAATSNAEYAWN